MAGRPEDRSEDIIRALAEIADRAEKERQEIREELREELKDIRGLLETALAEVRTSGQRKVIANALYEAGHDDERRDLGIPAQVRRHRRGQGESDGGHLKLVVPALVVAVGAAAAHIANRKALATTAAAMVGAGTLAGVTQIALAPSVVRPAPPAATSPAPSGATVPLPPASRPPPGRARLVKRHKPVPSPPVPASGTSPPAVAASPSLLPSVQASVTTPPTSILPALLPSSPAGQAPISQQPSVSPTTGSLGGLAPSTGATERHSLRGAVRVAVHAVDGLTGGLGR